MRVHDMLKVYESYVCPWWHCREVHAEAYFAHSTQPLEVWEQTRTSRLSTPIASKPSMLLTLTPSSYVIVSTRLLVSSGSTCRAAGRLHLYSSPDICAVVSSTTGDCQRITMIGPTQLPHHHSCVHR